MTERPILFSGPMVRAILDGRKTQTRRVYKPREVYPYEIVGELDDGRPWPHWFDPAQGPEYHPVVCPYGAPGDRLWVREAWARRLDEDHLSPRDLDPAKGAWYWADPQTCNTGCAGAAGKRRPGIHMPRWASRIMLEVTEVRVQRLKDISEEDARAEGCIPGAAYGARAEFIGLWNEVHGARCPWSANPWVWCLSFKVVWP